MSWLQDMERSKAMDERRRQHRKGNFDFKYNRKSSTDLSNDFSEESTTRMGRHWFDQED